MSRRITVSLLAAGLLGSFGILTCALSARAEADWGTPTTTTQDGTTTPTTTTPTATTTPTTTTTEGTTTTPAAIEKPHMLPTINSIQDLLDKGDALGAESAYLEWTNAWQEEDKDLFVKIETAQLQTEFKAGDKSAFIALLIAGDPTAQQQLREGKVELDTDTKVAAIRALGLHGGIADVPSITKLLQDKEPAVVSAAIQTLGDIGSVRCLPDLYLAARTADLENSILIAKAMQRIGASKQLKDRFSAQLKFPFNYVSKRACLMLAVGGVNANWDFIKSILDEKKDTTPDDNPDKFPDAHPVRFYPLTLSILGNLHGDDVQTYIINGLKGSDDEKLAALQSIDALPADKADNILKDLIIKTDPDKKDSEEIILNDATPANLRLEAINLLADRYSDTAMNLLRSLATSIKLTDSDTVAAAIIAAEKNGVFNDEKARAALCIQLMRDDAKISRAARTALLANGLYGK